MTHSLFPRQPVEVHVLYVCSRTVFYSGGKQMLLAIFHAAFPLQSAGGEWKGTCRDARCYVSQLTLLHHLTMWSNFSQCPALISLCGNSSLVPNRGARRAQANATKEKKGNNWNRPLPYTCSYIVYVVVFEGVYLISFRHFSCSYFEPFYKLSNLFTCLFFTVIPTTVT